jgi:hypothetical protein
VNRTEPDPEEEAASVDDEFNARLAEIMEEDRELLDRLAGT